jgi:polysaccharide transporter, PST family
MGVQRAFLAAIETGDCVTESIADQAQPDIAARRKLLDNIGSLYLLQGINYVIPMAVLPYLVRVLGMETYGLVAFAQSFAQYFNILTDYGFNFSATRSISLNKNDIQERSRIFCCVFLIKAILTLIGLLMLLCILLRVSRMRHDWLIYLLAFLAVVGNVLFPVWFFQGVEKMGYISVITGAAKIFSAILLFVFVHHPADALLAVAIQSSGMLLAGLVGLIACLHSMEIRLQWPLLQDLKSCASDGWHLFISMASVSLYTNTNVFLVGILAGNTQVAYFSAAEKLIRALSGMVGPITQAAFPHVNSLARASSEVALAFIGRSLKWMACITLLPAMVIFLFAGQISVLCFGHNAAGAVPVMRWIAPLPFLIAISNVLGVQTMLTFGLDRQFSRILILAGVLNILLGAPLILRFGAQGAGASVLTAESFVTLAMILVLKRKGIQIPLFEKVAA